MNPLVQVQAMLVVLAVALVVVAVILSRRLDRLGRLLAAADRAAGQALAETAELSLRLKQAHAALQGGIDHLGRQRTADAGQLDLARTGVGALRLMVEGQAGALDEHRRRVDGIERDAVAAFDALRLTVDKNAEAAKRECGCISLTASEVKTRLAELERLLANEGGWRSEVNERLELLRCTNDNFTAWLKNLQEQLTVAQATAGQAQQKATVADGVAALAGKTAARLERVDGSAQSLYTHLQTITNRANALEARVAELEDAGKGGGGGLADEIKSLHEHLQQVQVAQASGERELARLTSGLYALINRLGGAGAEARNALEGRE